MKPQVAVDIVARDKTGAGTKQAERSLGGFARRSATVAREGGFEKIGRQVETLTRFRTLSLGFDSAGRSLSSVGQISRGVTNDVGGLTRTVVGFGATSASVWGRVAAGVGTVTGAIAGAAAAVVGLTAAGYMLGDKWAKIGGDLGNRAKDLGLTSQQLQARRAGGERFGVSADQTDAALEGLGSTLYDAKYGGNNLALGALNQLGLKLKEKSDGSVDVDAMTSDIADAIAKQKNPQVQAKLAAVFGMSSMLPALRQGSAALNAEGNDYLASGAAMTDAEVARAAETRRQTVRLRQSLGRIEKTAGVAAMDNITGAIAGRGADAVVEAGDKLASGGREAAKAIVDAGRRFGQAVERLERRLAGQSAPAPVSDTGFAAFKGRIKRQESRGRQFDRYGRPLTSSAGAVGVMQVMPETGKAAAARAGIAWDERRFYNDPAYNEMIGTAELHRLYQKYGGNEVLAAAAYNAGEGRLDGMWQGKGKNRRYYKGWLERFGDPRKGEIINADFAARIPFDETRNYARKTADMSAGGTSKVEITIKGAPAGTDARVTPAPGMDVTVNVARGLDPVR